MERCDKCGSALDPERDRFLEMRLRQDLFEGIFLAFFDGFNKPVQDGSFVYRFCPHCVFETPAAKSDCDRAVTLLKESLGIQKTEPVILH